ncbi:MAG: FecR domain-containing protein [Balneolaceae bacterium]|nr:FecR domain-containing protein [Balneolaceae bacterium]
MNNISEETWVLITRKLSGEATPEEERRLRKWLDEDPKHREYYNNIESSWNSTPGPLVNTPFFFDYDSGLKKMRSKLAEERVKSKQNEYKRRNKNSVYTWAIAASVLVVVFSISLFAALNIWEGLSSLTTYETSAFEQRIITLSDGSVVRLNRSSKIEVEQNLSDGINIVRLEGEAFFDVVEDPDRLFKIQVDDAIVQVLGTSFNVKGGDKVMVAVQDGLVSFRHKDHEEGNAARLSAGDLGLMFTNDREIMIEERGIENYLSWKNGYLRFDEMPFAQVITQLERIYGIRQELADSAVANQKLTVYTERMEMEEVLETIALALDLTFQRDEKKIIWDLK